MSSDSIPSLQTSLSAHSNNSISEENDIPLVPEPTEEELNQREILDYRNHRENLLEWALIEGKNPENKEGYSPATMRPHFSRLNTFFRWVWQEYGGYTTQITHSYADEYVQVLSEIDEYTIYHKSNCVKAIRIYFKWRTHEKGGRRWDPPISFSTEDNRPQDFLTYEERIKVREASLQYKSIPRYDSLTPKERETSTRFI